MQTLVTTLVTAVDGLNHHERIYARVDLNLDAEHSYSTLTERQESLAQFLGCAAKTVRRRADQVLDSLAVSLLSARPAPFADTRSVRTSAARPAEVEGAQWRRRLSDFWRMVHATRIDIVCSEIPAKELPHYADRATATTCDTRNSPTWTVSSTCARGWRRSVLPSTCATSRRPNTTTRSPTPW